MTTYNARPQDGAAWITGGSTGIGKALAIKLADEGYTVYITARKLEKLELVSQSYQGKGKIISAVSDVMDREKMNAIAERIVKEEGSISLAVFNAGIFIPVNGDSLNYDVFDKTFDINFGGVINGMVPAVEKMKVTGRGQIAIVSSAAGFGGQPRGAAYGATKAALINMAECLKCDLEKLNIRMMIVTPGYVDTPLTRKGDLKMPFLMPLDRATNRFAKELKGSGFEITFPRRFTWFLKLATKLPYWIYFKTFFK